MSPNPGGGGTQYPRLQKEVCSQHLAQGGAIATKPLAEKLKPLKPGSEQRPFPSSRRSQSSGPWGESKPGSPSGDVHLCTFENLP